MKNVTVAVPDAYTINYSSTILDGLSLLQRDNALAMANLSMDLGSNSPPYADFAASPLAGTAPLVVQFTDSSRGIPISGPGIRRWNDCGNQNPLRTYTTPGLYSVSLNATNSTTGSDTRTIFDAITVNGTWRVHIFPPSSISKVKEFLLLIRTPVCYLIHKMSVRESVSCNGCRSRS